MTLPKVEVGKVRFELKIDISDELKSFLHDYLGTFPGFTVGWGGLDSLSDDLLITLNKGVTKEVVLEYVTNWLAEQKKLQNV